VSTRPLTPAYGWIRIPATLGWASWKETPWNTESSSTYSAGTTASKNDRTDIAKGIGPNGPCTEKITLARAADGKYVLQRPGLLHQATSARPKGILCVRAPSPLKVSRARFEWDFLSGPWSARDKSGIHNLGYFFLDRYRSGVVGNVNAIGPNKNRIKWMQNVGMAVCGSGQKCCISIPGIPACRPANEECPCTPEGGLDDGGTEDAGH